VNDRHAAAAADVAQTLGASLACEPLEVTTAGPVETSPEWHVVCTRDVAAPS